MTIKISELANLTVTQANTIVPVVSNVTGTLTTVQANVQQLQTYMLENAGNLIPRAGNIYSIGSPTVWWKDLWLSANTFYIGGVAVSTSGGSLTFGGNVVGTSDLPTYTGDVSAGNVSVGATTIGNITTAPTFSVEGTSGNITAGNITSTGDLATASVTTPTVTTESVTVGGSVDFVSGSVPAGGGGATSMISGGSGYAWGFLYYPSGGTGTGLSVIVQGVSYPSGEITGYTVYQGGSGYTVGDILTIDNAGEIPAVFQVQAVLNGGTMTSGESSWSFDSYGTTTFPGDTTIDSDGNISVGSTTVGNTTTPATFSVEGYTGNISAGNVFVYSVESDTVSLTLPTSASDMLPSYDGGVILSTGTISTNLTTQYWGFNPNGVTWFTVADSTAITSGMQIYWAGHIIGTVTGVTSGNVSCTPLVATPNFVNGSPVSFGDPAPLYTDEVTTSSGNLTITGNILIEGNVTNTGNVTFLQPLSGPPGGNLNISSPVIHNGNITVLSWLKGPPTANLNISSGSGQPIKLLANAGASAWTFNSNGSVTFPDNTLQTTAGTIYGNAQVSTFLQTYDGNIGRILVNDGLRVVGNIQAGFALPNATFANVIFNGIGLANSYSQLNIQNVDSVGTQNSADFIATAPNGTDSSRYIDMGINGNNYSSSSWTVSGKNDGYVYINSGNLTLGTDTPGTTVKVHVGGTLAANVVATFSNSNVTIGGNLIVSNVYVPTANNSAGTAGQIAWDSGYVYICIATNTWKRANISTW
jgi:hypothetical protein